MRKSRNKSGFTLTEIMIALIILAALSALAIPAYFRTVEQARSNEALANLNIIHMAEKIYRINNGVYWGPGNTSIAAANTALNIDMSANFYNEASGGLVSITANAGNSYTATLRRNTTSGGAGTKTYTYTFNNGDAAPALTQGGAF